jgi:hypothetical protein
MANVLLSSRHRIIGSFHRIELGEKGRFLDAIGFISKLFIWPVWQATIFSLHWVVALASCSTYSMLLQRYGLPVGFLNRVVNYKNAQVLDVNGLDGASASSFLCQIYSHNVLIIVMIVCLLFVVTRWGTKVPSSLSVKIWCPSSQHSLLWFGLFTSLLFSCFSFSISFLYFPFSRAS